MGVLQNLMYGAAKRWIAGVEMGGALDNATKANARGRGVILNYLGEDITDAAVADRHIVEYGKLQDEIAKRNIDGCISVKLTQLGLGIEGREGSVADAVRRLAIGAAAQGRMVWIDMEGSNYTSKTLEIYTRVLDDQRNVGVALQAYLRRSEDDLRALLDRDAKIRLVKGAYREPAATAFTSRRDVSDNYLKLMRSLFERGDGFAVATHDSRLIDEAKSLASSHRANFEFEFLKGIRDDIKPELVKGGYRVVEYMPYGAAWYGYSMRRIREHPSNIWLLLRSI